MPVNGKLLEILCCPVSKTPLIHLTPSRLKKLNTAIEAGEQEVGLFVVLPVRGGAAPAQAQDRVGELAHLVLGAIPQRG